ncbi:MAG: nitrogen fixation protein NifQ [Colwellia sp.]
MNIYIKREIDKHTFLKIDREHSDFSSFYKVIITSQLMGITYLPYQLGLEKQAYQALLADLNDEALTLLDKKWHSHPYALYIERSSTLTELFALRSTERDDLCALLLKHRNKATPLSESAATIIATACLSTGHLWKSLGFKERKDLTDWITLNFPALSKANKQMRWKRYLYLQLCKQGGDYVCRAPSCGDCTSFNECFLPA